jgi:hypothetical protein
MTEYARSARSLDGLDDSISSNKIRQKTTRYDNRAKGIDKQIPFHNFIDDFTVNLWKKRQRKYLSLRLLS